MPRYNRSFDLNLADVETIEKALRERVKVLSSEEGEHVRLESQREMRAIKAVLGRIHNQKVFYRPRRGYIGG